MNENLCLVSCFLPPVGPMRETLLQLDRELDATGSRLVLLSTWTDADLPFPVIPIPYLVRDFASCYPQANGPQLAGDEDLAESDRCWANGAYAASEALPGVRACRQVAHTLLETLQPGHVLLWNSTHPQTALFRQACTQLSIPVQTIERGLLPETLLLDSVGIQGWSDPLNHWLAHTRGPEASDSTFDQARSYYLERKPQKYDQPDYGLGGRALRDRLGLGARKVVVFFGQADAAGLLPRHTRAARHNSPVFGSTHDALMALCSAVERMPDTALVFKPHPLDRTCYVVAEVEGAVLARDTNLHALIELADVVVAQLTTVQYEAALYEKPVLLLARSAWWGRGATYEVKERTDLPRLLRDAIQRRDWADRALRARRFIAWLLDRYLVGCNAGVPARHRLTDFARFISQTSLPVHGLPSKEARWANAMDALEHLQQTTATATADAPDSSRPAHASP